ncbi:ester cyclase [Dyella lutea]|uniref:Ester cyclase n=1 Tax=Dyella lutea TaxID=2950441 RepID=A0ABT1F858_9GAMM|nr:ester cyclase [Dyella lutea]
MKRVSSSLVALAIATTASATGVTPTLVRAHQTIVTAPVDATAMTLAALRYANFWNTGNEALARAALAPDFVDHTPPPGRVPGVEGALAASRNFRAAVPDLSCTVEQLIVAGDRVVSHLRFRGHFTGRFGDRQGHGQPVDFIATDIYRIVDGRIADNWHLEDNLTLLKQLGVVAP